MPEIQTRELCHGNFGPVRPILSEKKKVRVQKKRSGDLFLTSTWLIFSLRVMAEFKEIVDDGSDCDDLVEEAYAYLVSKKYPECVSETKRRVIRRKAAKLTISVEGELLYKHKQGKGKVSSVKLMTCMYLNLRQQVQYRID